jgi:aldose sugar dehydrogenase
MRSVPCRLGGIALFLLAAPLAAQQDVPFRGDTPIAPQGLRVPPLPEQPVYYETAEGQDIRVVVLVRGLERPWSIAFVDESTWLVTERVGRLRVVRNGVLDPEPVRGVPEVRAQGFSGMLDVVLHPDFDTNRFVYFTYSKPVGENQTHTAVARGVWDGRGLTGTHDVFVAEVGGGSRIVFDDDRMLYMSTGGGGSNAPQDPSSLGAKVLRLTDDGKVPADNPFVGREGHRPEIFTLGHRNTLGLARHPGTGRIWQVEMGPNGGDEVNILEPGGNYGWPLVSLGRAYPGPWHSEHFQMEGFVDPVVYWTPSVSTSGIAFYTGDRMSRWKGDVFVGGMRYGEIPGTGRLERILINQDLEELRRESLLVDLRQRIRDVRQGPDELLYLLTDDDNGAIIRIEPAD